MEHERLIFKYHSSFCVPLVISTCVVSYLIPSSSSVMEIFWPLGVPAVYRLEVVLVRGKLGRRRSLRDVCFRSCHYEDADRIQDFPL